jgi:Saxitoxin biosynthesis operon protein SxtJ
MRWDIPEPDRKGLREFGLVTGGIFAGLFGLFFPWVLGRPSPYWPWAVSVVLVLWALIAPATMRGFYRLWMRLAHLLSRITTPVIMGLVFFVIITPTGFIMRFMGRDPMALRLDPNTRSYRIPASKLPKNHMERPF